MKIVFVSIYPEKGKKHARVSGVASYTRNLVTNLLDKDKNEIIVLCDKIDNKTETYKEDDIMVKRCFNRDSRYIFQLLKEIKNQKPDVIHIQQELALFGGPITALLLQILLFLIRKYKIFITLHGVIPLNGINKQFVIENNSKYPVWFVKLGFYVIYKPLCIWSRRVIVHEDYFKNILIKEYGVNAKKIQVIHHGTESRKAMNKSHARKMLRIAYNRNVILFMGYLTGYKGLDLLIEGFSLYAETDRNALLILGAGKHPKLYNNKSYLREYNRIQGKAKSLIPENQYKWVGFIEEKELDKYFGACDVTIFPYTTFMSSSGPMALSLSYGIPYLASEVFKTSSLRNKNTFILNPNVLSRKLEDFFKNKKKYSLDKQIENTWKKVGSLTMHDYEKN